MSATIVREKRQTTLPVEVCEPAGIEPGDQIDWRFEAGEIRGRKLIPLAADRSKAKTVRDQRTGLVYFDAEVSYGEMEAAALSANLERGE
jgi:bifunctional DNA-binding transcriptional regulator/antitoxin component of YhaV-PrlF toxin-antitoxin module